MNKLINAYSEPSSHTQVLIYELIENQRYGVEYQPMICTRNNDIMAYEALARFYTHDNQIIPPVIVFDVLHDDLPSLRKVEFDLKKVQLDYAPKNYDLFINIDPHAVGQAIDLQNDPLVELLLNQTNLVVELIENSDIHDARAALTLHSVLKANNIHTALDDIGADHALLSLEILSLVNYLKFDHSWVYKLEKHRYAFLFRSMLEFARQTNKPSILEGIENEEMLCAAKEYDLDRVQGFYFQNLFIALKP